MNSLFLEGQAVRLPAWMNGLLTAVTNVLNPILIIACLSGINYAIRICITFAKADDKNAREEAKQKLITFITGIVAAIALIALFYWLTYMIRQGKIYFSWLEQKATDSTSKSAILSYANNVVNIVKANIGL